MAQVMPFNNWIARWADAEYSLLRSRMNGVQFLGPGVWKKWDQCLSTNTIDLDDPIIGSGFKSALVSEGIISAARAEEIFAPEKS